MADEQATAVDHALWVTLRTLEENAAMNLRLAEVAEGRERLRAAALYRQRYEFSKTQSERLRELIGRVSEALEGSAVES